jgi:hypothetical protein
MGADHISACRLYLISKVWRKDGSGDTRVAITEIKENADPVSCVCMCLCVPDWISCKVQCLYIFGLIFSVRFVLHLFDLKESPPALRE